MQELTRSACCRGGSALPGPDALLGVLQKKAAPGTHAELLPTGNALVRYTKEAIEQGEKVHFTYWEIANAARPRHLRLAVFSYCVLASKVTAPDVAEEVALLEAEIRGATFSPDVRIQGK